MKGAPDTPNVVAACNMDGRHERLEGMLQQLEMCEKALQASQLVGGGMPGVAELGLHRSRAASRR